MAYSSLHRKRASHASKSARSPSSSGETSALIETDSANRYTCPTFFWKAQPN